MSNSTKAALLSAVQSYTASTSIHQKDIIKNVENNIGCIIVQSPPQTDNSIDRLTVRIRSLGFAVKNTYSRHPATATSAPKQCHTEQAISTLWADYHRAADALLIRKKQLQDQRKTRYDQTLLRGLLASQHLSNVYAAERANRQTLLRRLNRLLGAEARLHGSWEARIALLANRVAVRQIDVVDAQVALCEMRRGRMRMEGEWTSFKGGRGQVEEERAAALAMHLWLWRASKCSLSAAVLPARIITTISFQHISNQPHSDLTAEIESLSCIEATTSNESPEQQIRRLFSEFFAASDLVESHASLMKHKFKKGFSPLRRVLVLNSLFCVNKVAVRDRDAKQTELNRLLGPQAAARTGPWSLRIKELSEAVTLQMYTVPAALVVLQKIVADEPNALAEFAKHCVDNMPQGALKHDLVAVAREAEIDMHLWLWQQQ